MPKQHTKNEAILRSARQLAREISERSLRLSSLLVAIHDAKLYGAAGFKSWKSYVKNDLGLAVSTSYNLLALGRWLAVLRPTKRQRARLAGLGVVKAAVLGYAMISADDVDGWLEVAERENVHRLRYLVTGDDADDAPGTLAIYLHPSQRRAHRRAMTRAGRRWPYRDKPTAGELLEYMSQDYLTLTSPSRGE